MYLFLPKQSHLGFGQLRGCQWNWNFAILLPQNSFIQVQRTRQQMKQKEHISEISKTFLSNSISKGIQDFV